MAELRKEMKEQRYLWVLKIKFTEVLGIVLVESKTFFYKKTRYMNIIITVT